MSKKKIVSVKRGEDVDSHLTWVGSERDFKDEIFDLYEESIEPVTHYVKASLIRKRDIGFSITSNRFQDKEFSVLVIVTFASGDLTKGISRENYEQIKNGVCESVGAESEKYDMVLAHVTRVF